MSNFPESFHIEFFQKLVSNFSSRYWIWENFIIGKLRGKKIRIIYENEIVILNFYKIAFLDRTHTLKQHITVSPFHGVCQYSISNLYSKSTKERSKIVIHPVVHFQKYPSRFAFQFQNCRWDGIISVISIPNHASISSFFACSTRKFANLKLNWT